jgi:hypothetical protein
MTGDGPNQVLSSELRCADSLMQRERGYRKRNVRSLFLDAPSSSESRTSQEWNLICFPFLPNVVKKNTRRIVICSQSTVRRREAAKKGSVVVGTNL